MQRACESCYKSTRYLQDNMITNSQQIEVGTISPRKGHVEAKYDEFIKNFAKNILQCDCESQEQTNSLIP